MASLPESDRCQAEEQDDRVESREEKGGRAGDCLLAQGGGKAVEYGDSDHAEGAPFPEDRPERGEQAGAAALQVESVAPRGNKDDADPARRRDPFPEEQVGNHHEEDRRQSQEGDGQPEGRELERLEIEDERKQFEGEGDQDCRKNSGPSGGMGIANRRMTRGGSMRNSRTQAVRYSLCRAASAFLVRASLVAREKAQNNVTGNQSMCMIQA